MYFPSFALHGIRQAVVLLFDLSELVVHSDWLVATMGDAVVGRCFESS
jgi:hypothetical protein